MIDVDWGAVRHDAVWILRATYAAARELQRDRPEGSDVSARVERVIDNLDATEARAALGETLALVTVRMATGGPIVRWWWERFLRRLEGPVRR